MNQKEKTCQQTKKTCKCFRNYCLRKLKTLMMASLKGMRLCSDRLYRIVSTSNVNVEFQRRMSSTSTFVSNKLFVSRCCFSLSSNQSFSTKNQILFQNAKPKQESTLTHSKNDADLQTSFAKKGFICIFSNNQQFNGLFYIY